MIDEKKLLNLMVAKRIQMLLKQMDSPKADHKGSVPLLIEQAELVLKHLPESDRDTLNRYMEHLVDRMAGEESCLYVGGSKDGIRVMKLIGEMYQKSLSEKETASDVSFSGCFPVWIALFFFPLNPGVCTIVP